MPPTASHPDTGSGLPDASQLRVLMIGLSDAILTGQGGGDVRERHIEYARRVGHLHMIVYSPRSRDLRPEQVNEHFTIYPSRSLSPLTFVADAYRLGARICRAHPVDLVTTQDPFSTGLAGLLLARRFGLAFDAQSHASFFDNEYWIRERPLRHNAFNRLGKWVARRADTMRVVNTDERDRAIKAGVEPHRIEVINTPVNLGRFLEPIDSAEVETLRGRLGLPEQAPVVLWVGRMVWFKRLPTLLRAFALVHQHHPDACLLLVGDANTEEGRRARALAAELDLQERVLFADHVDHADLPTYFALADVYALSSVYEGLPKVLVEAAASGTPVVSTAMAGGRDAVLDGETGLLVEVENVEGFAAKLGALLSDPEHARRMGRRARQHAAEHYDRTRTIERIVAMWARCVSLHEQGG